MFGIAQSSEVSGGTTSTPKICAPCCVVAVEGSLQLSAGVTGAAQTTAVGSEGWLLLADGPGCQLELRRPHVSSVIAGWKQYLCLLTRPLSASVTHCAGSKPPFRGREDLPGLSCRSSAVMLQLPLQRAYATTRGRAPLLRETRTCSKHCWKSGRSRTACVSAADATPLFSVTKPIDPTGADGAHPGERVDAEDGPGDCNGRQRTATDGNGRGKSVSPSPPGTDIERFLFS